MNCPRCGNSLSQFQANEVELDVCHNGCGGIWFDKWELKKLDERSEFDTNILAQIKHDSNLTINMQKRLDCPKCPRKIVMMRHFHSVKRKVEVDECPGCGGYWLDLGELSTIHKNFDTEADRKAAQNALFDDLFGEKLKQMSEDRRQKAGKAWSVYEFLRPGHFKL